MITQEQKDTLNIYANIKSEIKMLETKAEEINPKVLEIMKEADVEEITLNNLGKLSLGSRRTYKYSTSIEEKEKEVKALKKEAEQTGKADYTEKHYVIFKGNKDE